MTKQEFETWVISKGYSKDKFGHYQKTVDNINSEFVTYRFKMQANSARHEKQIHVVDHNEWMRLVSGYYKNLSITEDGKLAGMKR